MSTQLSQEKAPLESMEHRDLLDIVDKLRSQGIGQFVDLPQIIVCGDQSSGKSSVLEAISGMSFPTKDNLCTRFATELILRRSPVIGVKVQINPSVERSSDEKKKLAEFNYSEGVLDMGEVVEKAKEAMGLNGSAQVFSKDILRVEISGPTQPHLTMVDLPGLFLAGNKDQSAEDSEIVKSLVLSYMKKPRSIILAVVSAKNDFALQQVTQHARALDPQGLRTLGLITKPDTLDDGSDSEKFFVQLAQNGDVKFRLGWHVLMNRNYVKRNSTTSERNAAEDEFFSKGIWTSLKSSQLGVTALRTRLSIVLRDQILLQLPSVLNEIQTGITQCREKLAKLGASRSSIEEQQRYLHKASTKFAMLTQASIDGLYNDVFFTNADHSGAYSRRLRAVVQNTLSDFAAEMRTEGHAQIIHDSPYLDQEASDPVAPDSMVPKVANTRRIYRSDYIKKVKVLMKESRGRELPGTYNPLIVSELFSQQCKPWKDLISSLIERVLESAYFTVSSILHHVADDATADALFGEVVGPPLDLLRGGLTRKVEELLEPHLFGHPITYNHYLTENVQKAQAARNRKHLEAQLKTFFRVTDGELSSTTDDRHTFKMQSLLNTLASHTEPNMDNFSCAMATDMMEAYYKVALKKLIDDVSILGIERCLIQNLPGLLSPDVVCDLTDEQIQRIAGESADTIAERVLVVQKLQILEAGMTELKCLTKHSLPRSVNLYPQQNAVTPAKRSRSVEPCDMEEDRAIQKSAFMMGQKELECSVQPEPAAIGLETEPELEQPIRPTPRATKKYKRMA